MVAVHIHLPLLADTRQARTDKAKIHQMVDVDIHDALRSAEMHLAAEGQNAVENALHVLVAQFAEHGENIVEQTQQFLFVAHVAQRMQHTIDFAQQMLAHAIDAAQVNHQQQIVELFNGRGELPGRIDDALGYMGVIGNMTQLVPANARVQQFPLPREIGSARELGDATERLRKQRGTLRQHALDVGLAAPVAQRCGERFAQHTGGSVVQLFVGGNALEHMAQQTGGERVQRRIVAQHLLDHPEAAMNDVAQTAISVAFPQLLEQFQCRLQHASAQCEWHRRSKSVTAQREQYAQ